MSWRTTRASSLGGEVAEHVAVIDLGSNSWRLVVFSYGPSGWWKRTDELFEAVRIGEGADKRGELTESAIARGLETLAVFARFCHANDLTADDVHPIATSAIRDASNRDDFLERARAASGLQIELLSAEQEAHYGYVAAINTSTLRDGTVLDIGGGSLQLIGVADRLEGELSSFPLGAVRMTERFLAASDAARPDRGARKKDVTRLRAHVREALADAAWLTDRGGRLVATGGAVRNLAEAALHAHDLWVPGVDIGVQGFVITPPVLDELVETLGGLPARERGSLPGIKPGRSDIILAAAVTLQTVLEVGGFDGIEATEAGLRDGLFLARTVLGEEEPRFPDVRAAAVRNLATQYESDMPHTEHVARLALQMHESLVTERLFEPLEGETELLWAAAMLHDVGMTISYDDHHKHSRYLIVSAELPGFDPRERSLIAQMTRYHRKGSPKLGEWSRLARSGDEAMLDRCALILRLAEHLERGRDQSVSEARLRCAGGEDVGLHLEAGGDLTLPRWSVERYGDDEAFARVFGRPLTIG